jgi:hypothetical protein
VFLCTHIPKTILVSCLTVLRVKAVTGNVLAGTGTLFCPTASSPIAVDGDVQRAPTVGEQVAR